MATPPAPSTEPVPDQVTLVITRQAVESILTDVNRSPVTLTDEQWSALARDIDGELENYLFEDAYLHNKARDLLENP